MENSEEYKIHIFSEGDSYKLYQGSMLDMLDVIKPCSIDSIVTDPPYELGFMGKSWDSTHRDMHRPFVIHSLIRSHVKSHQIHTSTGGMPSECLSGT